MDWDEVKEQMVRTICNTSDSFLMPIEDIFPIAGRGVVATGNIESGAIKVGDTIELVGLNWENTQAKCVGIELNGGLVERANTNQHVGLLLENIDVSKVSRGMVVATPNSIQPCKCFKAEVYMLKFEEGGSNSSLYEGIRTQFYIRTLAVYGNIVSLYNGVKATTPGQTVQMKIEFDCPVAMSNGQRFVIIENGKAIGVGTVMVMVN